MTDTIHIPNIDNYTIKIIQGVMILTPKEVFITEEEFQRTDFRNSSILECEIKDKEIISKKSHYKSVLVDIWKSMPTQKILQTTTFNFKLTNEKKERRLSLE